MSKVCAWYMCVLYYFTDGTDGHYSREVGIQYKDFEHIVVRHSDVMVWVWWGCGVVIWGVVMMGVVMMGVVIWGVVWYMGCGDDGCGDDGVW